MIGRATADALFQDVGWGSGTGRDKGGTMEKARKEAVTDGLKRVLKTFGSVMGNCIYQKDYQKRLWAVFSLACSNADLYIH